VTHAADHIDEILLSALVDDQLTGEEKPRALAHLETCAACQQHLNELRSVVSLLRGLPDVPLPRDFSLGPRLLVDPPNVIRLRQWYGVARTAAASLAAAFVFLSVGTLYVDSRSGSAPAAELATRPQIAQAPVPTVQNAPAPSATAAVRSAAPAQAQPPAAQAPAPAAAGAAARPASSPQADDQVAAATSIRPLPTPVPTPLSTVVPPAAALTQTSAPPDPAMPLRIGALIFGILAVLTLLAAVVVRHRLQRAATQF
jgi:hypothetical protein